ncbi:hypothetical protein [Porphyromonas pogonae]|uniref:hypothetical protein n=1 Tax=Porphyromonas pogonae TaxID=867595 RepID=UPI002E79A115|nr:hypothetical protein [Porphyromonas pogonae]
MRFSYKTLYATAAIVWLIAGGNVLRIGIKSWSATDSLVIQLLWLVISISFFGFFIFPKVVKKNVAFIEKSEENRLPLYKCFTKEAWYIMIFMISLGVMLRVFSLVPDVFIAGFYTGLGSALMITATRYIRLIF